MSLINHDGDLLGCGNDFIDCFDANTGIWWYFDDDNITQISDLPKGVYIRERDKNNRKKKCQAQQMYYFFVISEQAI